MPNSFDDKMIFYPAEILDARQKEFETKNPEAAKRADPERAGIMRPEYYEQELER